MKIYLVGGAVRDKLLGLPVKERDWVVVNATVAEMQALGYQQVGKEFPVFLHPKTNEEYALARTERKIKPGYQGFTFDTSHSVTLTEDLQRRDLTINAMAETASGELIDPYQGKNDLEKKILRHVSPAFAEDPVRILRIGRFLARYHHLGFTVAPETRALMREMVKRGEVDALVAERVWKELERALTEKNPEQFFAVLADCAALPILFPELTYPGPGMQALISTSTVTTEAPIRFAAMLYAMPESSTVQSEKRVVINDLCNRYRVPNAYRELAQLTARHYPTIANAANLSADELVDLFSALDIFRREERFHNVLLACEGILRAQHLLAILPSLDILRTGAKIAKSVDIQALIASGVSGQAFANQLKEKRCEKLAAWLKK